MGCGDRYPVIRINFRSGSYNSIEDIHNEIRRIFRYNNEGLDLDSEITDIRDVRGVLFDFIQACYKKYGKKVVVLIDEYDKPILDNITEREKALTARESLRNFYSAIKDCDRYIRFVFITGVSKFSKMNLFSGLNNLEDITVDPEYGTITGYTNEDLIKIFGERLEGVDP